MDAWACVVRHRAAPKTVRRKIRYLALWCSAPVAAKALEEARQACLAVRADVVEDAPLPGLVDLSLKAPSKKPVVVVRSESRPGAADYDAPD